MRVTPLLLCALLLVTVPERAAAQGSSRDHQYTTADIETGAPCARTGKLLWQASLGGQIVMAPITFQVEGKKYVSVISGHTLVTFALR